MGCGGIQTGRDVIEYLIAGARAVAIGTALLAEPNAGRRILAEMRDGFRSMGVTDVGDLVGTVRPW